MLPPPRAAIRGHPWVKVDAGEGEMHPGCDQSILPDARADSRVTGTSKRTLNELCEGKNEVSTYTTYGDMYPCSTIQSRSPSSDFH